MLIGRHRYVGAATRGLRRYIEKHGDDAKTEINKVASAHVLTMDLDTDKKVSYCACGITGSGQLAILWEDGNLASNIDDVFNEKKITTALNDVPSEGMSYETRVDIKAYYEDKISEVQEEIKKTLGKQYTFEPGFEAAYAKLSGTKANFKDNLGSFVYLYYSALSRTLVRRNFDSDDMLQEGFNEAVESGKIAFRIVDASQMKDSYNEAVIEDGVLYLQVCASNNLASQSQTNSLLADFSRLVRLQH